MLSEQVSVRENFDFPCNSSLLFFDIFIHMDDVPVSSWCVQHVAAPVPERSTLRLRLRCMYVVVNVRFALIRVMSKRKKF